ncbi:MULTISPECIES: hypothetical protein [Serratia]|nr:MULTISPECIES: hypothetical protein [Serratia]
MRAPQAWRFANKNLSSVDIVIPEKMLCQREVKTAAASAFAPENA